MNSWELWEVIWGLPMRPSSGGAGRSGRESWTPDSKVFLWFLKDNVTEYWEVWTNPDVKVF